MRALAASLLLLITCAVGSVLAATEGRAADAASGHHQSTTTESDAQAARGERVFNQNCSRCHDAPEALPPAIAGEIVRHMRVRASLSAADEKALLHFINRE